MPRKYKQVMDGKRGPYTTDKPMTKFQRACDEVKEGHLSVRGAASKYGFSKSTISDAVNRKHSKRQGGQTVLSAEEEACIVERLVILSQWGFPLDTFDLRILVKLYLDRRGITVRRFKNNFPGWDWGYSFLKRHKHELSQRVAQNIKVCRAAVTPGAIRSYFANLEKTLKDVPPNCIINYDETNLSDDPGRKKVIVRRGCKYPERIMNFTKSSTSLMFACTAAGKLLPSYVVYRSKHMYDSWTEGGPPNARYNRTESGWFDGATFEDWFFKVVLPYAKSQDGKKVMIGDNLSSHVSLAVVSACEDNNISFVLLPPNSTHLTQPLDVSVFRPMKGHWRSILTDFKSTALGRRSATMPKGEFPKYLARLIEKLQKSITQNIISGFKKCGVYPLNAHAVLSRIPEMNNNEAADVPPNRTASAVSEPSDNDTDNATSNTENTSPLPQQPAGNPSNIQPDKSATSQSSASTGTSGVAQPVSSAVDASLISMLSSFRYGPSTPSPSSRRKRKLTVPPGKSVTTKRLAGVDDVSSDSSSSDNSQDHDDPPPVLEPEQVHEQEPQPSTSRAASTGTSRSKSRQIQKKTNKATVQRPVRLLPTSARTLNVKSSLSSKEQVLDEREIIADAPVSGEESTDALITDGEETPAFARDTESDMPAGDNALTTKITVTTGGRHPNLHEWVVVRVSDEKQRKSKYYMAVVTKVTPVLKVRFLKHVQGTKNVFVNSNVPGDESCEIDATDIIQYVKEPKIDNRERMLFDVNAICWPK